MRSEARVVVIGGGVVGATVLYHLTKAGWTDVMLLERSELTSGSTWHAAGGMHTLNGDPNVAKLQDYTIGLYRELEEISGQSCGTPPDRRGRCSPTPPSASTSCGPPRPRAAASAWRRELVTPLEAAGDASRCSTPGTSWARSGTRSRATSTPRAPPTPTPRRPELGAAIVLRNRVVELTQDADGGWRVVTEHGTVTRRACGQRRRPLGARGRAHGRPRAAGARHGAHVPDHRRPCPRSPPSTLRTGRELLHSSTSRARSTRARSATACCSAPTSRTARPWSPVHTPWDFGNELLAPDLDRIAPSAWRSASSTSRRWRTPGSSRWSTAPSPSPPTATRWSGRCRACATSGAPAG